MELLPHQIEDAAFLSKRKGVTGCFSGMGSGKTRTALEATNRVYSTAPISEGRHILIIGPPISLGMWKEEAEDHLGLQAQILKTGKASLNPHKQIYICSYEIATKRYKEMASVNPLTVICDESHALKSTTAKRTQAILGEDGLYLASPYVWLLTGTPSTRWNDDLYPFLLRAAPDLLNKYTGGTSIDRFRLRYCITQRRTFPGSRWPTDVVVGNRNTQELHSLIFGEGLAVRRELKDVWENMPPITFNHLEVRLEPSPELREVLEALKHRDIRSLQDQEEEGEIPLATMRRVIGKAKVRDSVKELKSRLEAGYGPILVGAWHTDVIDALANTLRQDHRVAILDGRTSQVDKQIIQKRFNAGSLDVLVGQIGAMGVSLNLQGGSHIVVVESDWSPAVMDQFYARCHRIGQKSHVHVDILEGGTKLDQAVRRIVEAKKRGHNTITGGK